MENKTLTLAQIVGLSRKAFDDGARADVSRLALIDGLIGAGYTFANTASFTDKDVREGKVTNENRTFRESLMWICAATVKIKGKRMTDADLQKFTDEGVSNKVMLSGTPKGNISKTVTWKGNATSHLGKIRNDLKAREEAKDEASGKARVSKTDTDFFKDHLQTAYTRTFKADVTIKADLEALQKAMRDVAKIAGFNLSQPQK
jgi:S-adenosylmethionine/arginine decarboxylase-like enzyme